ncbi:MAG TPA: phosphoenolpyruvate carboxykinase (GTP), partial [Archaeoglobaceae archaeon]|nr:phosphoenolpyruvate carboxykinase (GTP) [Archaeoglobaceae archaeon]
IIAYGAALETLTTFAVVEEEGKYEINAMSIQDFLSISLGEYLRNYLEFGKKLREVPLVFGVNYFLRDLETGEFLNDRRDKHVWVKWMEERVHNDVNAIEAPTGLIPEYEDVKRLFKTVLNKDYSKEDYEKQFTVRVEENLKKIRRVKEFYEKLTDTPEQLFKVLDDQKQRLLDVKEKYGNYLSPFELY